MKELSSALQQHRDEFAQFISGRRLAARRDMRTLFQTGTGVISRFGDLIAESTLESVQAFERANLARLCRDAVLGNLCLEEDIPSYFLRQIFLASPLIRTDVITHPNRLEVHLSQSSINEGAEETTAAAPRPEWGCIYATAGLWRARLMGRPTVKDIVKQTQDQILLHQSDEDKTFVQLLSRLVDAVHPSHGLTATILAYPAFAASILKRRLTSLGYEVPPGPNDDPNTIEGRTALTIVAQLGYRLQKEHEFYFEFATPHKTAWRVGFTTASGIQPGVHTKYPGEDEHSFGFSSSGEVYWNGKPYSYCTIKEDPLFFMGFRTWGIVVDLYDGRITLVVDGKAHSPAFGTGATAFDREQQKQQRAIILSHELIPTFALRVVEEESAYSERPQIRVNFGDHPFTYNIQAQACNEVLRHRPPKALDTVAILEGPSSDKEKLNQEDEEKFRITLEKNYVRATLAADGLKSFSHFPPSVYRKSLACTKIQRAWRAYRGRKMRARIREEQYRAAMVIQLYARKKLQRLRVLKNEAAAKIQRNWRRRKFIWLALLRCIYQQPIPELHRSASIIQRKWKHWHMFKNSPIAAKYNANIEDLQRAVNKIISWWRPLHQKLSEVKRLREKHHAATTIQRVYRGYHLRQLLRPDLRHRLRVLGESVARHRKQLLQIRAAYIIQGAWRNYLYRRVRAEKVRTRHRAAARLQALWKGYWVRSHIHFRFTYGEAVFLTAVCKSLRNCHFILKMYKPCGIVCPRREIAYTRDGQKIVRA
ncbi:hypothetical protein BC832DRAFT_470038 [Gaertneriomyces semiglobifer]|nr:hypothetical protein BC832DRAFT_470038 [Gaertneriomyces semiglobifer]